jgi:DNA (cytosine-5)-methyltransferase 1
MKFIDLFCGIGGFRLGFERNGFECVFSSDFNAKAQDTYESNFGERPTGDITQVNPIDIPDFDVLLGGFPCQPFSISGRKLGFEDTRGTLFFDVCRIIEAKKPKVVVLENVKHLINHDKKKTISVILNALSNLGYNVSYKILNLKDLKSSQSFAHKINEISYIVNSIPFFQIKSEVTDKFNPSLIILIRFGSDNNNNSVFLLFL